MIRNLRIWLRKELLKWKYKECYAGSCFAPDEKCDGSGETGYIFCMECPYFNPLGGKKL